MRTQSIPPNLAYGKIVQARVTRKYNFMPTEADDVMIGAFLKKSFTSILSMSGLDGTRNDQGAVESEGADAGGDAPGEGVGGGIPHGGGARGGIVPVPLPRQGGTSRSILCSWRLSWRRCNGMGLVATAPWQPYSGSWDETGGGAPIWSGVSSRCTTTSARGGASFH